MIVETARVVALDGDRVWVETLAQAACGHCAAKPVCGQGLLAAALGMDRRRLLVLSSGQRLALQDRVEIGLPEQGLLQSAGLAYLLPLLALLLGILLGDALGGEPAAVLGSLVGLGLGVLCSRQLIRGNWVQPARPVLLRRLDELPTQTVSC